MLDRYAVFSVFYEIRKVLSQQLLMKLSQPFKTHKLSFCFDFYQKTKLKMDFDLKNFTYREGDIVALVCVEKYLIKNEWIQRSGYRASEETKTAHSVRLFDEKRI